MKRDDRQGILWPNESDEKNLIAYWCRKTPVSCHYRRLEKRENIFNFASFPNLTISKENLKDSENCIFLSLNASSTLDDRPELFFSRLCSQLPSGCTTSDNFYGDFHKRIETFHQSGKKVIVFLDDFHFITSNKNFPLEFFSFLRSMANNYNLAYVTTSFLELQKLCKVKEIQESPFFNIFTNMHLAMISFEDAIELYIMLTGESKIQRRENCEMVRGITIHVE